MVGPRMKIPRRTLPTAPPVPTTRNSYSARAIMIGSCSRWWMEHWCAFGKAALANAFTAAKRSMPSGLRPCRGRGTALSARKSWSRDCWKRRRRKSDSSLCAQERRQGLAAILFQSRGSCLGRALWHDFSTLRSCAQDQKSNSPPCRNLRDEGGAPRILLRIWLHVFFRGFLRSWHCILQRSFALVFEFGMRKRLTRQHLIAHGSVVDEDRFYGSRLREIIGL